MTKQELTDFWAMRKVKIWIVDLEGASRKAPKTDRLIVRAGTLEKALIAAKNNSLVLSDKKCFGRARYAHPVADLHCEKVNVKKHMMNISNLNEKGRAFYQRGNVQV